MIPPTQRQMRSRFLTVFDAAQPEERADGEVWYPMGTATVRQWATTGTLESCAAVMAALSPQLSWDKNVEAYKQVMADGTSIAGVLARSYRNAVNVLDTGDPDRVATGPAPKTRAFAWNLAGDLEAVTIDRHMFDCAADSRGAGDSAWAKRRATYEEVASAVRWVAEKRGTQPATAQAIIWIVWRNRTNNKTPIGHGWKDITSS